MNLVIKPAGEGDLPFLEKYLSFGTPGKHAKRIKLQEGGKGIYLIAWQDKKPIGHAFLKWDGPNENEVREKVGIFPNLEDLLVVQEERSKGIGVKIMEAIEQTALDRGYKKIGFGVAINSQKVIKFYENLGYKNTGIEPFQISWEEPDGKGGIQKVSDICIYMTKELKNN